MKKIAIVGLSCLLPDATNPEQFWQNLIQGKNSTSLATEEQMGVDANIFYASQKGISDRYYCLQGGYIKNFQFDASGYQVEPDLLKDLDPLYQWSLYVAKEALQDSGYLGDRSILNKCGVILGNLSFPTRKSHHLFAPIYHQAINSAIQKLLDKPSFQLNNTNKKVSFLNSNISGYPASLITQALSLSGINFSLDAACASSLYSIKLACDYLLANKVDLMLAGAVSCGDPLFINQGFSIFQAYPEKSKSCPLNKSSGGLIAGEGAGMVVLKRYEDAIRDGDRIYATINGIGLSNDGKGKFVLQPSSKGQILAFERAYNHANINPNTIDYIECHATGTPVGDIVELNSMETFFSQYNHSPLLGSVKSNLGHLLTTAGIASLIKVILSINKNLIPPTINISEPLHSNKGNIGGKKIVTSPTAWEKTQKRAGISAFGFGGCNAHLILESSNIENAELGLKDKTSGFTNKSTNSLQKTIQNRLAIVGMDAFFGECDGLDAFDQTIYDGKQHFIPLPPQRWQGIEAETELLKDYGFVEGKSPKGAYIKDFDFDFLRFKIPPKEEDRLIPQQLLMLKVADRAIQDAGLKEGGNIAVIIAMETELALHQYRGRVDLSWQIKESLTQANINLPTEEITELENIAKDSLHPPAGVNRYTSVIGNIMASRIASKWDFTGASFTISAGENSVFKALEVAQLMLSNGEVEAVVLGAIDLAGGVESVLSHQKLASINTGAKTLSFDENSNGWMVGEGSGAVVLKLYDNAKENRDRIYAVVDAVSLLQSNDRDKSPKLVEQVCKLAFETTEIQPKDIGYLEIFGSGIPHENEAEIKGILQAYKEEFFNKESSDRSKLLCCLGSIKANIGHTYAASGIASLIKTALCVYHRYIPAAPNWTKPKQLELWKNSPFYVAPESRTWFLEEGQAKRVAAINSLGIDNTYAHLILSEETIQKERPSNYLQQTLFYLFPIRANNQEDLLEKVKELKQKIENDNDLALLATRFYQYFPKNIPLKYTLSLIGSNKNEILKEIKFAIKGIQKAFQKNSEWKAPNGSYFTANPLGKKGKIAFVYPPYSKSYPGLGQNIFHLFPDLYEKLSQRTKLLNNLNNINFLYPKNIVKQSNKELKKLELANTMVMLQTGIGFAIIHTLIIREYFKINPDAAFGNSLGEISMLEALEIWNDDDRSRIQRSLSPCLTENLFGSCLTVRKLWNLPVDTTYSTQEFWGFYQLDIPVYILKKALKNTEKVYINSIHTPNQILICGLKDNCLKLIENLKCNYIVPGENNYNLNLLHIPLAKLEHDNIVNLFTIPVNHKSNIQCYSVANYEPIKLDSYSIAKSIAKMFSSTVDFPRLVNKAYQDGVKIFIELGAGNFVSTKIIQNLKDKEHLAISINTKGVDDYSGIIRLLAKLISHGVSVDLSPLYPSLSKVSSQAKSIIKQVTLGGDIIHEKILTFKNKEKFNRAMSSNLNQKTFTRHKNEDTNNLNYQHDLKINQLQISVSQQLINQNYPKPQNIFNIQRDNTENLTQINTYTKPSNIVWDETDLLEFARGNIANVFGGEYKIIDSYSRRVRLPLHPYLLVSRVTKIDAKIGEFKPSSITTEYDIPDDAWYSVDRQIPGCIAIESGQCDLLLISYLGIDFENKGKLVYRLLDCTLTFLDELPKEGDTLRYDIKINSFAKSGDNLLFFFSYECFVKDKMIIKMDGGCAGFFSDKQLKQGKGVIVTEKEIAAKKQIKKQKIEPLLVCTKSSFDEADIFNLIQGNLAECFGEHYHQHGLNKSLRFPPQKIMMIDKITSVDTTGGDWGLGLIIAEKQLEPEHWYFPCHFQDDPVLAGSLQSEGCSQLLQFYLLYLGLHTCTQDARFQPIYGQPQVVRCRGQVTPISAKLIYRLEVKEIGLSPHPYAKCNVDIILQGKTVVHFQDLGLQLIEKNPDKNSLILPQDNLPASQKNISPKPALLTEEQVQEFCMGSVTKCFGKEFAIYDNGKVKASRMPNTHLSLVSRVLEVKGERHQLKKGSTIITEYDVPINPWFYRQNSSQTTPYSILMEIALQPCGFLSAYLGTTLLYPDRSLYFRNLDGDGTILKDIDIRGKTLTNKSTLLSTSNIQGMILQSFEFEVSCEGEIFYQGSASFGHFSPEALANQVGLDRGKDIRPWYETENSLNLPEININLRSQSSRNKYYQINPHKPHYRLAKYQLDLLNEVKIIEKGGKYQQGYIYARKEVKLTDWYFKCHFYQDPVMPGSLGVEAMLQAMQVYALHLDLGKHFKNPCFIQLLDHKTIWKYRGQIPPEYPEIYLEIHISKIDIQLEKITIIGDTSLWKPKMRIYEVKDLAICLVDYKNNT